MTRTNIITTDSSCLSSKSAIKDPGSSLTHFIGLVFSLVGISPIIMKASRHDHILYPVSMFVFMLSMILLYGASTTYHTFDVNEKVNRILKKIDHMMISVLIAGSYTPVCLLVLGQKGILLFGIVWTLAIVGILIKAFWVYCPKWFSSCLYIGMGWTCLLAFSTLLHTLSRPAFNWLLAGGMLYTIGGIIYACKLSLFNSRHPHFGSHEIFHLFVMGGSLCHYICMYGYIA